MISSSCGGGKTGENWGGGWYPHPWFDIWDWNCGKHVWYIHWCTNYLADEASWCETINSWLKLTVSCCSNQLSKYLHLAKYGVRTRKCTAKRGCLHKHTRILWVWNGTTGTRSWTPVDSWIYSGDERLFSAKTKMQCERRVAYITRVPMDIDTSVFGCCQMAVMVDLRLNRSSADWINNVVSMLWMWGAPVLKVQRGVMD